MLGHRVTMASVVSLLFVAVLGAGCKKAKVPSSQAETPSEREALLKEAFAQAKASPVDAGVDRFFVDLARAVRGEAGDVSDFVDVATMARNMEKLGLIDMPARLRLSRPRSQSQVAARIFSSPETHWDTHEVRQVVTLASTGSEAGPRSPTEVVAMVVHRHADGRRLMRWWLIRTEDGPWKLYDFEYVNDGIRYSSQLALVVMAKGSKEPWLEHAALIGRELRPAMSALDLEGARKAVEKIDPSLLPPSFRTQYLNFRALLEMTELNFEASLATVRSVREVDPKVGDSLTSLTIEMTALRHLERYAESIAIGQQCIELFGPDEDVLWGIGEAQLGLDRPEDAAKAFREGLTTWADCTDCLLGLIQTKQSEPAELARHLGRVTRLDSTVLALRTELVEDEDAAALGALIAGLAALDPKRPELEGLRAELTRLEPPVPD